MIVRRSINQRLRLQVTPPVVNRQKEKVAQLYQGTYEGILWTIVNGRLIHADETQVSIEGKRGYVLVFTNLEDVIYSLQRPVKVTFCTSCFEISAEC